MYRSTSYGYEDQNSSSLMPFLMGCMIGIGVSVLYSAGRNNRLGAGVGNVIHTVEDKAVQAKDTIVQKAADIKTSVAERVGGHKDGQTHMPDAMPAGTGGNTGKRKSETGSTNA